MAPRGGRSRVCRATVWKCRLAPPPQSVQKTPASPSSSGLWGPGSHPGPPSSTVCPLGVSRAARGQGRASGSLGSRCTVARSCPWNSAVPRAPRLGMLQPPQKGPPQPWPSRRPFQGHHRSGDALRGSAALGGGWGRPRRGGGWRGRGLSPGWTGQAGGPGAESQVHGRASPVCVEAPRPPASPSLSAPPGMRRVRVGGRGGRRGPPVMGSTRPGAGLRGGPRRPRAWSRHACCCPGLCVAGGEELGSSSLPASSFQAASYVIVQADLRSKARFPEQTTRLREAWSLAQGHTEGRWALSLEAGASAPHPRCLSCERRAGGWVALARALGGQCRAPGP